MRPSHVRFVAEGPALEPIVHSSLLTQEACCEIVRLAEEHASQPAVTGWSSVSGEEFATEDVEVDAAPALRSFLLSIGLIPAIERIFAAVFAKPCIHGCDDLFVVKYNAAICGQRELALHVDGGDCSFMVALSARGVDYGGGGTHFERGPPTQPDGSGDAGGIHLHMEQGDVLAFPAKLYHRGLPIDRGVRYLLVGFCYTDDPSAARVAGHVNAATLELVQ